MDVRTQEHRTITSPELGLRKVISNLPPMMMEVPISAWTLSMIVDVGTNNPYIVGTAFPIGNGVLLTAKHILNEYWNATESFHMDRTLSAFQILPGNRFITWRITGTIVHKTADLAVLFAAPNVDGEEFWFPSWKICKNEPRKDEWAGAFGNVKGTCQIVSRNADGGGIIEVRNKGQGNFGVINNVYNEYRDRIMLPCPCFEIGVSFGPGMSGGPVFNEQGEICGIVSSSIEGSSSSHAVTLWPSLSQIYQGAVEA